jgi:hypothetical protein
VTPPDWLEFERLSERERERERKRERERERERERKLKRKSPIWQAGGGQQQEAKLEHHALGERFLSAVCCHSLSLPLSLSLGCV